MSRLHDYISWFEYEKAMQQKVLQAFGTVPAGNRDTTEYQKVLNLFSHLISARHFWLLRLGFISEKPAYWFSKQATLTGLQEHMSEVHQLWDQYFESLDEAALAETFDYTSTEGELYRNSIEDLLIQLHGHGCYHNGQIASMVRALQGTPASTDYIYWSRQRVTQ